MSAPKNKAIGYLRISSESQELDNQKFEILRYAQAHKIVVDEFIGVEISSRKSLQERRIDHLLERLAKGDLLLVSELSRLGRSLGQVVKIVDDLIDTGVRLIAIKENIVIDGKHDMQSKVMVTLFGLFAEIERDLISERTKMGLAAARSRGKVLGRPRGPGKSKLDPYRPEIEALLRNGSSKTFVAERYGTSLPNLYNWIKKHGISVTAVAQQSGA